MDIDAKKLYSRVVYYAAIANNALPYVLYKRIITERAQKPNIVYIDFVNNITTQAIILYNFS